MMNYRFGNDITLESAAEIICSEYRSNPEFRKAAIASALSAIEELRGSTSDEEVARVVAHRIFCGEE